MLGAVQLCSLPWLGFVPDEMAGVPAPAVARLSARLEIPAGELRGYGTREQTRTDHLREVARYAGWRPIDELGWKELEEFLPGRWSTTQPGVLFGLAGEYLSSARVICPRVVHLLTQVAAARERARVETRVEHLLDRTRRAELATLLVVDPQLGMTRLRWLGLGPTQANPAAVTAELNKLAYLRRLDAHTLDLSMLPAERRRFLAGVGRRLTGQALSRREPQRRYPILLTVLAQSAVDVLDEVVLLFDQALSGRESAARTKLTAALAERARGGDDRQALLDELLTVLRDPDIADDQVGQLLRASGGALSSSNGVVNGAAQPDHALLPASQGLWRDPRVAGQRGAAG